MSGLLSLVGLIALVVALVGVARGQVRSVGLHGRGRSGVAAVAALVVMGIGGSAAPDVPDDLEQTSQTASPGDRELPVTPATEHPGTASSATTSAAPATTPPPAAPPVPPSRAADPSPASPLLVMAAGGDGDSWEDRDGVEYRMGLVNAPEVRECGGSAATAYRKRALAGGFRAEVYATDRHGRRVAVILTPDGTDLNVAMARDGIANDRFLAKYRHENPALAARLDAAFREARAQRRGIWRDCERTAPAGSAGTRAAAPPQAPQPAGGGRCHPDYTPCIPVKGNGSGRGGANDLDCGDVGVTVTLRSVGRDPYRLDGSDGDGLGCE